MTQNIGTRSTYSATPISSFVPPTRVPASIATIVADGLVAYLRDFAGTNSLPETNSVLVCFVNVSQSQNVSNKTLWAAVIPSPIISNAVLYALSGMLTNMRLVNCKGTNFENYGSPLRSPGTGNYSEQFGVDAVANGDYAIAFGNSATAIGDNAFAVGPFANAVAYGVALGQGSTITGIGSVALGPGSDAGHTNCIVISTYSNPFTPLMDNENVFGGDDQITWFPGSITVDGTLTSLAGIYGKLGLLTNGVLSNVTVYVTGGSLSNVVIYSGITTNTLGVFTTLIAAALQASSGLASNVALVNCTATNANLAGSNQVTGTWAWNGGAVGSFAAGLNRLDPASYQIIECSASANFTIAAITNGFGMRPLSLVNNSSYTLTLAHESGWTGCAPERLSLDTGADVNIAPGGAAVGYYASGISRWRFWPTTGNLSTNQPTAIFTVAAVICTNAAAWSYTPLLARAYDGFVGRDCFTNDGASTIYYLTNKYATTNTCCNVSLIASPVTTGIAFAPAVYPVASNVLAFEFTPTPGAPCPFGWEIRIP